MYENANNPTYFATYIRERIHRQRERVRACVRAISRLSSLFHPQSVKSLIMLR